MLLTKSTNNNIDSSMIILILYLGLVGFFIYKLFKSFKVTKNAEGEILKFKKNSTKWMYILLVFIALFGVWSIIKEKQIQTGLVMIALSAVMTIESLTKYTFAENGLALDGVWVYWKQVKKWGLDPKTGELAIAYKDGFKNKTGYMKLRPEDANAVSNAIKKYKFNK